MNAISTKFTLSNVGTTHELSHVGLQERPSALAHEIAKEKKEATQQLQQQLQQEHTAGFFEKIGNFLTGSDGGTGNVLTGSAARRTEQSKAAWDDRKFLKLR